MTAWGNGTGGRQSSVVVPEVILPNQGIVQGREPNADMPSLPADIPPHRLFPEKGSGAKKHSFAQMRQGGLLKTANAGSPLPDNAHQQLAPSELFPEKSRSLRASTHVKKGQSGFVVEPHPLKNTDSLHPALLPCKTRGMI